jgi:cell division protein FtsB
MIASFQDRFNKLKSDHDNSLHKLLRNSKSERHNNQTSIDRITKNHNKQMFQLESEYRVSLIHVKNQHNKKISCMHKKVSALEASIDKKDLRRKALENEVHDLNEWVLELDNERIAAETERKGAVANERSAKRKYAHAQSKCRSAKKKYAQKYACMESKCSELQNEIEQLKDWVFELDNERKYALNHQQTAEKMYARAKSDAYL